MKKKILLRVLFTLVCAGIIAMCVWFMCNLAYGSLPEWLTTILEG